MWGKVYEVKEKKHFPFYKCAFPSYVYAFNIRNTYVCVCVRCEEGPLC